MKKLFVVFGITALIYACGGGGEKSATDEKKDTSASTTPQTPATSATDPGLEMIAGSDCITCHKISEKNIGPAYIDVSKKYEATPAIIDTLANRVIKGSVGHWGQVQMTPHPNLSMDSARTMVKYVLNLKNTQ